MFYSYNIHTLCFDRSIFGEKEGLSVKRLKDDSDSDSDEPVIKKLATEKPTDILSQV
jgi:hypothetical protein